MKTPPPARGVASGGREMTGRAFSTSAQGGFARPARGGSGGGRRAYSSYPFHAAKRGRIAAHENALAGPCGRRGRVKDRTERSTTTAQGGTPGRPGGERERATYSQWLFVSCTKTGQDSGA
jgi:hypothetical protein